MQSKRTRCRASFHATIVLTVVHESKFIRVGLLAYSDYMCMPVSGREERAGLSKLVCNLLGLMFCESEPREQETKGDGTVRSLLLVPMQIHVHHFSSKAAISAWSTSYGVFPLLSTLSLDLSPPHPSQL